MKLNKLFLLLLPLSLVACNNKQKDPEKPDPSLLTTPLCMTCTSDKIDGLVNIFHTTVNPEEEFSLQYSKDNKTWHDVEFIYRQSTFHLKKDETIYFRGNNPEGFNLGHKDEDGEFVPDRLTMFGAASGTISIGGNIMSLISSTDFDKLVDIPSDYCFGMLFSNYGVSSYYTDASKLSLPATKLKKGCYMSMFTENSLLEYAPVLPATDLATDCYFGMFMDCQNLKKLQVAFDETAFNKVEGVYPYTSNWLENEEEHITNDGEPIFIWPGPTSDFDFEQNESTIPATWIVEKTPTEVF